MITKTYFIAEYPDGTHWPPYRIREKMRELGWKWVRIDGKEIARERRQIVRRIRGPKR